jgi:GntR family transcriptional repressor for pyruvate dehydrogenase complex
VAFDNNYRPRLWSDRADAQAAYARAYALADLAFVTLDDEAALHGRSDLGAAFDLPCAEVVVKRGAASTLVRTRHGQRLDVPVTPVTPVDTTAAGDSFAGGLPRAAPGRRRRGRGRGLRQPAGRPCHPAPRRLDPGRRDGRPAARPGRASRGRCMNRRSPATGAPRTLALQLVDTLAARIRGGQIAPGGRLPTEAALMAEQGVSRTVVREALSQLQASGLVETRHGIGTFVLDGADSTSFRIRPQQLATLQDVVAVLELRIGVETEAAGLAAQRRSDRQLAVMRAELDAFEQAVARGDDAVAPDLPLPRRDRAGDAEHALRRPAGHPGRTHHPARPAGRGRRGGPDRPAGRRRPPCLPAPREHRARKHLRRHRAAGRRRCARRDAHPPGQQPRTAAARTCAAGR